MRHLLGRPETAAETRASIVRIRERWAEWGYGWWALLDAADGAFVGAACLQHLDKDVTQPHEIGWRLRRAYWGAGFASEAARAIVQHAFEAVDAPLVCAIRHPDNLASQRVMDRLGMRYVGLRGAGADAVALHELTRAGWQAAQPSMH